MKFQSTRPRGARLEEQGFTEEDLGFNPRARAGRDLKSIPHCGIRPCFNPRARAGRD